eukprot:gene24214-29283_t
MPASNSYILRSTAVSNTVVEGIYQQLVGKNKKPATANQGKSLLAQVRLLLVHHAAVASDIDLPTLQGLLSLMQTLSDGDNNNTDRKVFRCLLFLVTENLSQKISSLKPSKPSNSLQPYLDVRHKLLDLLYKEGKIRVYTQRALALRHIGMLANHETRVSSNSPEAEYLLQALQTLPLPSRGNTDLKDNENKLYQAIGVCSALRRANVSIPVGSFQILLNVLRINNRTLIRHASSLLLHYAKQDKPKDEDKQLCSSVKGLLKQGIKDEMALGHVLQAARVLFDKKVEERMSLMEDVFDLVYEASLKTIDNLVTLFMSSLSDWDMLACLEGGGGNLVKELTSRLGEVGRNLREDDVFIPLFCRVCEKLGKFFILRPPFGNGRTNKIFSVRGAERDGEALRELGSVVMEKITICLIPKGHNHPFLPPALRAIYLPPNPTPSTPAIDHEVEARSFWGYETMGLSQGDEEDGVKGMPLKSAPSPYILACLVKAMLWVLPDERYCSPSPLFVSLWKDCEKAALLSLEVIKGANATSEVLIGEAGMLTSQILSTSLQRVQLSTLAFAAPSPAPDLVPPSPPAPVAAAVKSNTILDLLDLPVETSKTGGGAVSVGSKSNFILHVTYSPPYVELPLALLVSSLRLTSSPLLSPLAPLLWRWGVFVGMHYKGAMETRAGLWESLYSHWIDVCFLAEGAQRQKSAYRKEVLLGLRETALWYLAHTLPQVLNLSNSLHEGESRLLALLPSILPLLSAPTPQPTALSRGGVRRLVHLVLTVLHTYTQPSVAHTPAISAISSRSSLLLAPASSAGEVGEDGLKVLLCALQYLHEELVVWGGSDGDSEIGILGSTRDQVKSVIGQIEIVSRNPSPFVREIEGLLHILCEGCKDALSGDASPNTATIPYTPLHHLQPFAPPTPPNYSQSVPTANKHEPIHFTVIRPPPVPMNARGFTDKDFISAKRPAPSHPSAHTASTDMDMSILESAGGRTEAGSSNRGLVDGGLFDIPLPSFDFTAGASERENGGGASGGDLDFFSSLPAPTLTIAPSTATPATITVEYDLLDGMPTLPTTATTSSSTAPSRITPPPARVTPAASTNTKKEKEKALDFDSWDTAGDGQGADTTSWGAVPSTWDIPAIPPSSSQANASSTGAFPQDDFFAPSSATGTTHAGGGASMNDLDLFAPAMNAPMPTLDDFSIKTTPAVVTANPSSLDDFFAPTSKPAPVAAAPVPTPTATMQSADIDLLGGAFGTTTPSHASTPAPTPTPAPTFALPPLPPSSNKTKGGVLNININAAPTSSLTPAPTPSLPMAPPPKAAPVSAKARRASMKSAGGGEAVWGDLTGLVPLTPSNMSAPPTPAAQTQAPVDPFGFTATAPSAVSSGGWDSSFSTPGIGAMGSDPFAPPPSTNWGFEPTPATSNTSPFATTGSSSNFTPPAPPFPLPPVAPPQQRRSIPPKNPFEDLH